ncbi:MAG: hypothetical protein ABI912_11200 [Actinomycetota bacterium]
MSEPTVPDRADDDSDVGWGESPPDEEDDRLSEERPPHHEDRD